jgi:phospholipid transport system substrate-binding protein
LLSIALALVLAAAPEGSASAAVQTATEQIRIAMTKYVNAQGKAKEKARAEARRAVAKLIDFDELAKATLGKTWDERTPAQRKRYVAALRGAMEANYLVKMGKTKAGDVAAARAEILGEERQGDRVLVRTRVHAGQDSASIDYLMAKGPSGWRAVDVITEGVSLADTYREQVAKLLPKRGFDGVVNALEKKRKSLEQELEQPASAQR